MAGCATVPRRIYYALRPPDRRRRGGVAGIITLLKTLPTIVRRFKSRIVVARGAPARRRAPSAPSAISPMLVVVGALVLVAARPSCRFPAGPFAGLLLMAF